MILTQKVVQGFLSSVLWTKSEKCSENTEKMWIKNIYWRLEDYSNVLVIRNRKWYAYVLPSFIKIWNVILQERKTGYEHRRPNKRGKKVKKINDKAIKLFLIGNKSDLSVIRFNLATCFFIQIGKLLKKREKNLGKLITAMRFWRFLRRMGVI